MENTLYFANDIGKLMFGRVSIAHPNVCEATSEQLHLNDRQLNREFAELICDPVRGDENYEICNPRHKNHQNRRISEITQSL